MNHYPLGQPVPNSVHAVCCSLPTMEAVIGYEEGRPEVTSQVKWAYPRFVFHDYVLRVMRWVSEQALEPGRRFYPTVSTRAAERLVAFADPQTGAVTAACGLVGADLLDTDETFALAKAYLQHTGVCLSSRAAERFLLAHGVVASLQAEERANSAARVVEELAPLVAPAAPQLSASGMNAVHAALDATQRWQGSRGRRVFVQFGWLYLDTQEVLGKLLGSEDGDGKPSTSPVAAEVVVLPDVTDLAALDALFAARGREIAGLITEVPTNPLLQVPDLKRVQRLCHAHGAVCIVDPSLGGVVNLDVLPFCDILVSSLTKYAAHAGDVMMGLLALNPDSPYAAELAPGIAEVLESPDAADVLRLAAQIGRMREVARQVNANTAEVANWLAAHPGVARLHQPDSVALAPLVRPGAGPGGILSLEVSGSLAAFYDRVPIVKGPSFGTIFTMMCPFVYLAHYKLVTSELGRAKLAASGLHPELVRLSLGDEPVGEIIAALDVGLSNS